VFQALNALVETRGLRFHTTAVLTQAVINAVIGVVAFAVVENGPAFLQRRSARGASLSRRRY
jgi:hypothetical protein